MQLLTYCVYDKYPAFACLIFDLVLFITSRGHYVSTFTAYANFKVYNISACLVKMTVVSARFKFKFEFFVSANIVVAV